MYSDIDIGPRSSIYMTDWLKILVHEYSMKDI